MSGHPLVSGDKPISSALNVNSRSLFTILTSCLVTIFACTWVSVHPNVPPPKQSKLTLFCRRLGLMLVAVVAPELMAGFAARQFLDARWFSKEYGVSLTHGFFFAMGGFVSQDGHHPIVTQRQLLLFPGYVEAIQSIKEEDIEDKSKGDSMSKGVALLQGLWFIAQCLARVHQHLPLTELEVATLAFQFVSVLFWGLWWHKPLDARQPILIGPADEFMEQAERKLSISSLADVFDAILLGVYSTFDPVACTSVPAFWSIHVFEFDSNGLGFQTARFLRYFFIQVLTGTVFGIIQCAAWKAHFPSTGEMLLWRSCSLVVASVPLVLAVSMMLTLLHKKLFHEYPTFKEVFGIRANVNGTGVLVYVVARVILIALAFTTLRALPPAAFVDVNWTTYIPHL
ncbi:hypothetical protein MSAN_00200300 [Mycena sanguinolenta]|uniref:Uncharacterized protein n=1 Tax=Mycena sanguinolenta TaxID=230812 RepID=A0A8H7DKR2_9AGAR|nr:hypothetical protein MSAN_00200300 [Mycena sanguinolenta]